MGRSIPDSCYAQQPRFQECAQYQFDNACDARYGQGHTLRDTHNHTPSLGNIYKRNYRNTIIHVIDIYKEKRHNRVIRSVLRT